MTGKFLAALFLITAVSEPIVEPIAAGQTSSQAHTHSPAPQSAEAPTFNLPPGKTSVQVPFELLGNAIYVSARMNGKGPFLFAIDTGSCCSVLAAEKADELGVKPEGETKGMGAGSSSNKMGLVKGKIEFSFPAGLTLSTEDANTLSFAGLWPLIGRPFYGNIGYDVLKDLVVQFDYERKIVTFSSPAAFRRSGDGQVFNTTLEMNYDPQFAGAFTVSGLAPVPTRFTVDTGAGGTIINAPLTKANHLMENVRDKLPSPSHGIGEGESNDLVARIAGISLGRYELQRPLVALSQDTEGSLAMASIGVNLGGNLLRRFTVTIDYPGRTLTLEPNSHFADPFPADASGLILKAEGDDFKTFIVSALVPDSPATAAGLQQGDVITAIDGRPADKYVLWELQELFKNSGHIVTLGVRRGSRSFTCRISLRSLV